MNEKNLVICDREIRYANILAENFSRREELAVKVHVCSSLEMALELMKEKEIHIFIVDESYPYKERCTVKANQIFVLGRGKVIDLTGEEYQIRKYQCADQIIGEVYEVYIGKTNDNILRNTKKKQTKIIAVYSPIHRTGKTKFAIALGKAWAHKNRVLYLNMEEYSGLEEAFQNENNLGDLLYYLRQGMENLSLRLQICVNKMEELEYLPPIPLASDLKEVTKAEWEKLLEQIIENSMYHIIILDMGESVQGGLSILNMCDRIYMPILEDDVSTRKLQQFDRNVRELKLDRIGHITYRFVIPEKIEEYAKIRAKEEI